MVPLAGLSRRDLECNGVEGVLIARGVSADERGDVRSLPCHGPAPLPQRDDATIMYGWTARRDRPGKPRDSSRDERPGPGGLRRRSAGGRGQRRTSPGARSCGWGLDLSCTVWGGFVFWVGFFVGMVPVGWSSWGTKPAVGFVG